MSTQNQRNLSNIGVFDIRNASEEAIKAVNSIGNVGLFITSRETASQVTHMQTKNVGAYISAPSEARFINAGLTIGVNYFKDRQSSESLIVNGRILIEEGVAGDDLEHGLQALYVNGSIFYPSALESIIQSKIQWHNGASVACGEDDIIEEGRWVMDESYLNNLDDDSIIITAGRLDIPDVLPNDLLERKVRSLKVAGSIRLHEENRQVLRSRIHQISNRSRTTVIPSGFQLYDMPVELNNATLQSLNDARMFVDGRVVIERDTDPALLDSSIAAIGTTDILICPEELQATIAQKCDLIQTRAVIYRGELWLVEDELEVAPSRFDFMEDGATLVVWGEFSVSPDVEPKTLADRFEAVHNFGEIYCSQAQMGAIQARMKTSQGELLEYAARDEGALQSANYGYLAL
ncbi:MAG: hypothetical protein QF898_10225 [SAR202 cluster bacterium]|jgi:hypothetical protein|nr:hypothetical protein [SAR202 cluster bacterium]MDP6514367.1 hypothetical protein [SAR202 cluster bacterium]MDP6713172.1 hypothetical protein [SAR202 cluster bacterium]